MSSVWLYFSKSRFWKKCILAVLSVEIAETTVERLLELFTAIRGSENNQVIISHSKGYFYGSNVTLILTADVR